MIWGNRFDFFDYDPHSDSNHTWKFVYPLPDEDLQAHDVVHSNFIAFPVILRHVHLLPPECINDADNISIKKISLYDAWRQKMEILIRQHNI